MEKLKIELAKLKTLPFPKSSDNEELNLIHAEIAEYDGYVAGVATSTLEGMKIPKHFKVDDQIRDKLQIILEKNLLNKNESELAAIYLGYLKQVNNIALELSKIKGADTK